MYLIYTHKANGKQVFLNKKEFFSSFNLNDAESFLNQIKNSFWEVDRDRLRGAYYSGLRYCFAEIDMLGKFYKGEVGVQNTAENSIAFMKKYMGSVNERYKKLAGLIIDMYRHGLMHTHMTKIVGIDSKNILGWELQDTDSGNEHLNLKKADHGYNIVINVNQFIKDFLAGLDKYRNDLKKNYYLTKFKKGYFGMAVAFGRPSNEQITGRTQRMGLTMKHYSLEGIEFIKREMT